MEQKNYEIYYGAGLKDGVLPEQAIADLAALLKLDTEKAASMIRVTNRIIKKGLTKAQAEKYFAALDKVGMQVAIKSPHTPEVEMTLEQTVVSAPIPNYDDFQKKQEKKKSESNQVNPPAAIQDEGEYRDLPVEFNGQAFEYFKIWIVNIFLIIITLGIYSAWAKVRNKQYFYGNTLIDGSSFQYTAKPLTILKGRLIAVAIFVLFTVAGEFFPIIGLLFALIILAILPWLIVRSLAFNARNSVYRNIRFDFTGSQWDALKTFLLWPLLIFVTFGLALPFILYKQSRFFVSNSAYGTTHFEFNAMVRDYFKVFFIAIGAFILVGIIFGVLFGGLLGNLQDDPAAAMAMAPLMAIIAIVLYAILFGYFAAALGNIYFSSSTLQRHGFTSTLTTAMMTWLYVSNTLAILLSLGLMIPWAKVRMARYRAGQLQFHAAGSLDKFVAAEQEQVSALGDQMGEVFDMGVSVI